MSEFPIILAIESSCDDTAAAVISNGNILSNIISSQHIHQIHGGVVPELASRAHEKSIIPVVNEALAKANINKNQLNAVAFTQGPGLLGSLLVGNSFAKSMAMALDIHLIGINHIEAHIFAHFIDNPKPNFPFMCLTVSGGHTQIVMVYDYDKFEIIGQTLDDAVGEAFDKTAKLLNLTYPGGPLIDKYAQNGNPNAYTFPIPDIADYNFSFSGVKTAIMYFLKNNTQKDIDFVHNNLGNICASVQYTLIEILIRKLKKAAQKYNTKQIAIAGGVAANSELRKRIQLLGNEQNIEIFIPKIEYCTDNAAMIAISAHYKYLNNKFSDQSITSNPRLTLNNV